jgi:hypothetical protein
MNSDTSPEVRQKQLEIWLSKPPMERLRITLEDNDALFAFWDELKKNNKKDDQPKP